MDDRDKFSFFIKLLQDTVEKDIPLMKRRQVYDFKRRNIDNMLNKGIITAKEGEMFNTLYNLTVNNTFAASEPENAIYKEDIGKDIDAEPRNHHYAIKDNGVEMPFDVTAEEREQIFQAYPLDGRNMTLSEMSDLINTIANNHNEPEMWNLGSVRKLLRAMGVYKNGLPFPPEYAETRSDEELDKLMCESRKLRYILRYRKNESNLLRKENLRFVSENERYKELLDYISRANTHPVGSWFDEIPNVSKTDKKSLLIYLADMHVGCKVNGRSGSKNIYNMQVAKERVKSLAKSIYELAIKNGEAFDSIVICNLGDGIDSYKGTTNRGTVMEPDGDDWEIFDNYVSIMKQFLSLLYGKSANSNKVCNKIQYFSIGDSNHPGAFGYAAENVISEWMNGFRDSNFTSTIEKGERYRFEFNGQVFVIAHGNDSKYMNKGWGVLLDKDISCKINEYLDENELQGKYINWIKGDTHTDVVSRSQKIRYRSVPSFIGSTNWTYANFGETLAAVAYDIMHSDGSIEEGRITFNSPYLQNSL